MCSSDLGIVINDIQRAYGERVRIRFDQRNVTFVLESRCPDLKVQDVVKRFELVPKRRYFRESWVACGQ